MTCPKTEHILQEYLADDMTPLAAGEIRRHLASCSACSSELDRLLQIRATLQGWQDARVPHWDRGMELYRKEHPEPMAGYRGFAWWQWLPVTVSMAVLCLMLLNVSVTSGDNGITLSFGGMAAQDDAAYLEQFQQQQEHLEGIIARFEARQDATNAQLMQAAMSQSQQITVDSLDRLYAYFEEQRRQDMANWHLGYQQLADSDYATIQSLQDLARYVSFQSGSP